MTVAHTVFSGLEFEEVKTALLAHLLATSRE
jgi:hypothetical protein